jgi:hypothetical protein
LEDDAMKASRGYAQGVVWAAAAMVTAGALAVGCTVSSPNPTSTSGSGSGSSSSGSSSGGGSGGCAGDPSLQCDPGSVGVDCAAASDNPEALDPTYVCSDPSTQTDGTFGYCCASYPAGGPCGQDTSVQGCAYPSVGFSCTGSDTPEQTDPSITCSESVVDPTSGLTLYCCQ